MRILIIDDEVRLTRHLTSALTEAGHEELERDGEALGNVADMLTAFFERRRHERAG